MKLLHFCIFIIILFFAHLHAENYSHYQTAYIHASVTNNLPSKNFSFTAKPSPSKNHFSFKSFIPASDVLPNWKKCKHWEKRDFIYYLLCICGNLEQHQHKILDMHSHYTCKGFIEAIKTLPNYETYILILAKRIHRKILTKIKYSVTGLKSIIYKLEKEIYTKREQEAWQKQQKERQEQQRELQRKSFLQSQLAKQQDKLGIIYHNYKKQQENNKVKLYKQKRITSLERHLQSKNRQHFYSRSHKFSHAAKQKLRQYTNNTEKIQTCFGNQLQHDIHQEFVALANKLSECKQLSQLRDLEKLTYQTISLGIEATQSALIPEAYTLADFCWTVLDCTQAVGEGVLQGTSNVIDMALHPIEAIHDIAYGMAILTYAICRPAYDTIDISCTYLVDPQIAEEKWKASCQRVQTVCDAITNYFTENLTRDIIRDASALVTESLLLHYGTKNISTFFRATTRKATKYLKQPSKQLTIATAEGVQIQIADETGMILAEIDKPIDTQLTRITTKLSKTEELFTLKFWQKIEPFCQKTNFQYHEQPIYKIIKNIPGTKLKKGDLFYLDAAHMDHVEVFRKNYKAKLVMNLDGAINEKKTSVVLKQKRSIKKVCK